MVGPMVLSIDSALILNKNCWKLIGDLLTYLFPDETGARTVFAVNLSPDSIAKANTTPFKLLNDVNNEQLSLQEQLRRERMRLFTAGIASYEWADEGKAEQRMIIPQSGKIMLLSTFSTFHFMSKSEIYDGRYGEALDPHISPKGQRKLSQRQLIYYLIKRWI